MISLALFDTLQYAKKAKEVGFTEAQAEFQSEAIADLLENRLATKQDFVILENNLKRDIQELENNLKRDIQELEYKLTIKLITIMGSMLTVAVGLTLTFIKFFI
ncbi:hypothetical protein BH10PSE19_BH10PSE19_07080 [soil metagenome]